MEPVLQLDTSPWSSDYEVDTNERAFRSVEQLVTKTMKDHGTQTVENPFEHNEYFHCRELTLQEDGIQQDPCP
ncbi:hypothetical protein JTB14_022187 [Gonioctena quinquepunctata]|nr:hypothetical protein JTB14_022187 [Gonioctena quinquepunctata]